MNEELVASITSQVINAMSDSTKKEVNMSEPIANIYEIGKLYTIRTITMIYTGKLVGFTNECLYITNASWIAETNRYNEYLADPSGAEEVEMYPPGKVVELNRGGFLDVVEVSKIPTETK